MRSDDFSPDKLILSHRCCRFCLPSSAHCLKNENKLSMEISYQLFWNKQYKLLNNYVWGTHIAVELEAYQQGPKCPNCLGRCQDHQDPWWQTYPLKNHTSCKVLPSFGKQNGLRSENCTDLLQNPYHDGSLGVFSLFEIFMVFKTHPLQDIASCIAWDKLVEL